MSDKPLVWVGSSLDDTRTFPREVRRAVGYQLQRVQNGLNPSDWKPVPSVGPGVNEIRIHTENEHRVLYVTRFSEAVYVLHAFHKKSPATRQTDIELARRRLARVVAERKTSEKK
jgi:phage-related protein